jgi:hypothetical protein
VIARRRTACALLLGLAACRQEPVDTPVAPHGSADAIGTAPVQGTLRGKTFVAKSARLVPNRQPGRERVDVMLSAADAPGCAPLDRNADAVWLRVVGASPNGTDANDETIAGREQRIGPDDSSAWSLHYQVRDGRVWTASGRAAAVVRVDAVTADGWRGVLGACFPGQSCVSGAFDAIVCPDRLDPAFRE